MTCRNPSEAERKAHAKRVSLDRKEARLAERCRNCDLVPEINPRTGTRFVSCKAHRKADRDRKAAVRRPRGQR